MEPEKKIVDYESTAKKLEEAQSRPNFWNPKEGKFEIEILSELSTYQYQKKDKQGNFVFDDKGAPAMETRAKVDISSGGNKYVWSFGIGATKASTYGQLVELAVKHGNKLTGQKVTVVIKNDGKKRDFTIV